MGHRISLAHLKATRHLTNSRGSEYHVGDTGRGSARHRAQQVELGGPKLTRELSSASPAAELHFLALLSFDELGGSVHRKCKNKEDGFEKSLRTSHKTSQLYLKYDAV